MSGSGRPVSKRELTDVLDGPLIAEISEGYRVHLRPSVPLEKPCFLLGQRENRGVPVHEVDSLARNQDVRGVDVAKKQFCPSVQAIL